MDSRSIPSASLGSLWPSSGPEPGCDWIPETQSLDGTLELVHVFMLQGINVYAIMCRECSFKV